MATLGIPSTEPGSSYSLPPSPSTPARRSQWTFSTQRAGFTRPVPAGLLPVYATFPPDSSDSKDEDTILGMLTEAIVKRPGEETSTAEGNSQAYQDVNTKSTAAQTSFLRGFAAKSKMSLISKSTPDLLQKTTDLGESPSGSEVKPERNANSVITRLASFLGFQKRQERQREGSPSSVNPPRAEMSLFLPAMETRYSPFPFGSQSEYGSSLSVNTSPDAWVDSRNTMLATFEDDCERPCHSAIERERPRLLGHRKGHSYTSATYPPVRAKHRLPHNRSHSLDLGLALARVSTAPPTHMHASNQATLIAFTRQVPSPNSRSEEQSRRGQTVYQGGSLMHSSYFARPVNLPTNCLLVQVWAVGLDESDRRLAVGSNVGRIDDEAPTFKGTQEAFDQGQKEYKKGREEAINRSTSFRWPLDFGKKKKGKELTHGWLPISSLKPLSTLGRQTDRKRDFSRKSVPDGGEAWDIPGQSFVGRVLEVESSVDKSFAARDDWVVGLVDVRKCGPLTEFIVIDWRQVHRVPVPYEPCPLYQANSSKKDEERYLLRGSELLTLDELALLPLCSIPAYRAVKTCTCAASAVQGSLKGGFVDEIMGECPHPTRHHRALVLRGHDGVGVIAVQMLIRQGWRVSVHVPFSRVPWDATQSEADAFMLAIEDQLKKWGVDEVIYDDASTYANCDGEMDDRKAAVVRVIETLRADGDVFDAILDFVGGKEIREAGERLLRLNGNPASHGVGQFTTLLGATPDDPTSTFAGFRSKLANPSTLTLNDPRSYNVNEEIEFSRHNQSGDMERRRVKYTPIRGVFESEDEEVCDILGSVLRLALEDGIRPSVEEVGGEVFGRQRVVSLEKASDVLVDGDLLSDGGHAVFRVRD